MRHILTYIMGFFLCCGLLDAEAAQLSQRDPEIRDAVSAYIQQKTAQLGYEIRIRKMTMSGPTDLPAGQIDYEVAAPQNWEGWGNANIAVIARQGSRVLRNIPVRVEVEALVDMVVPVHQIDQGRVIAAGDVVLKKWDISGTQGKYLTRLSDAVGRKARSTVRPNAPLKAEQIERVALIRAGQAVMIVAESGNMRISVTGRAKNAGAEGDTIIVQNPDSLKEFPARIIDAKTVAIML